MTTSAQASTAPPRGDERQVPPLGGFNLTALKLEVRRVLRNRRTVMFILVFPSVFFFMFGLSSKAQAQGGPAAIAYVMISMAVYGAMVGTTAGGAAVAVERSLGWSRQLRLTPLRPGAYVAMKVLTAMTLGLIAIVTEFAVGAMSGVHLAQHVVGDRGLRRGGRSCGCARCCKEDIYQSAERRIDHAAARRHAMLKGDGDFSREVDRLG